MFNPGKTNTYNLANADGSGYTQVSMSQSDWGFTDKAKRSYVSVDLFLEHPFDEKWYGRIDYTWSHSYGNTEGQVKSDLGQADVSKTQDWDSAELMYYAGGSLANDRRHQIKAFGAYQINPEWMASATLRVNVGHTDQLLGLLRRPGCSGGRLRPDRLRLFVPLLRPTTLVSRRRRPYAVDQEPRSGLDIPPVVR